MWYSNRSRRMWPRSSSSAKKLFLFSGLRNGSDCRWTDDFHRPGGAAKARVLHMAFTAGLGRESAGGAGSHFRGVSLLHGQLEIAHYLFNGALNAWREG